MSENLDLADATWPEVADCSPDEMTILDVSRKCPDCSGLGIIEKEAGLISWACPICKGTGEVADDKPSDNGDDLQRGDSGDKLDSPTTGSGVAREPAKPKKRKASKKTRKARR